MAQRISVPASPSDAWLLCAACGPLSGSLAAQAGIPLNDDSHLEERFRNYTVLKAPPFLKLKRWIAAHPAVQAAMEQVESQRRREGARKRKLSHDELAGSARAALLLGRGKDFQRCYQLYTHEQPYEWHPDPQHLLFWDAVLGPGWQGADAVPEGAARDEIVLLTAEACAFFAIPQGAARGTGLCGAPAGVEMLEMAAALRAVQPEELLEREQRGCRLAPAVCELMNGRFAEAQQQFVSIFRRGVDCCYSVVAGHGMPLLLYALVGGVLGGGNARYIEAWFGQVRYAVEFVFPPCMGRECREMIRFLDNLQQVDAIVNRQGCPLLEPDLGGPLSCLPFALVYRILPSILRQKFSASQLADAVLSLKRQGLELFARWGACGLTGAAGLSAKQESALSALRQRVPGGHIPLPVPMAERAVSDLMEIASRQRQCPKSLYWGIPGTQRTVKASLMAAGGVMIRAGNVDVWDEATTAALLCMASYARNGTLLLEGCTPAEFTRLFTALQGQVNVVGSLAAEDDVVQEPHPEAVLLFSREWEHSFRVAFRLRLLPGTEPLMLPGCGLEIPVLVDASGSAIPVQRDMKKERVLLKKVAVRLQQCGLSWAGELLHGEVPIKDFDALAGVLQVCREQGVECCWEKGQTLRLYHPQGGLSLQPGKEHGSWFELGGGLPVDEGRVWELSALLEAFSSREGKALVLGEGEYVLLTPALERQLALLTLVSHEKHGRRGVASAAIPLLEAVKRQEESPEAPTAAPVALPEGLQATLRPYQEAGFRWLAERAQMGVGALLADDMGLGKTVQVLALLLHVAQRADSGPFLVIAPVSLLGNWAEEAVRFAPSLRVITFDPKCPEALEEAGCGTLVLASYGQVTARLKDIAAHMWELLVLDEAQAIKNPDAQRSQAVCALKARTRLCLTGTPVENSLLDLWSQMRFLNPGLFGTRAAFQRRFKRAKAEELALLRQSLSPLVLRRTKSEVLKQLPALTETVDWVDFSAEERSLYESLRRAAVDKLGEAGEGTDRISILAELTRLRRACCHGRLALPEFTGSSAKLAAMAARVSELRASGRRVLIFSQFTDVLDLAEETLREQNISWVRLDGSTPTAQRNAAVRRFQQGKADAFLISLKAGGTGLNLTAADYVMLLDPWWNPAVEAQAAGRSHRIGQKQPVTLCRFMVRDTVEERILALHRDKKELAEQVLSGQAEAMSLANLRVLLQD